MRNNRPIVGIAREGRSPENPSEDLSTTDLRVSVVPRDVKRLIEEGCTVLVETGAGEGIGFKPAHFEEAGSRVVDQRQVLQSSDVVLKLKGPATYQIEMMEPGSTMGCFAHLDTFPERLKTFQRSGVNLIALEDVVDSPEQISDDTAFGRGLAEDRLPCLARGLAGDCEVVLVGFNEALFSFAQQASRMGYRVAFIKPNAPVAAFTSDANQSVVVYDSNNHGLSPDTVNALHPMNLSMIDLVSFGQEARQLIANEYRRVHPPKEKGRRKVECLSETGMCGMRYGFELLQNASLLNVSPSQANVVILGYGNVAHGAIKEALSQGAQKVFVLGRGQIGKDTVVPYLEKADVIVNGIDLGDEKGKTFIVTREHIKSRVVREGAVVIDLIGGSKRERSAIENILECTFLDRPYFDEHGVIFSALWGWPMMYMMRQSSEVYSGQITDLLLGEERLIDGLDREFSQGVEAALHRA